jgi:ribosomal 50S subunit-recycling heat shock protein
MRIDLALKYLCILKSRSSAKHLCIDNAILVNDLPVKPSAGVRTGDKITIHFPNHILSIQLLDVPDKQLSKSVSPTYYQQIANIDKRDVEDTPE